MANKISSVYIKIILISLFMLNAAAFGAAPVSAKDDLKDKQAELNRVYKDLMIQRQKLMETKRKQESVIQRLYVINRDLRRTKSQLGRAESQISQNERRIVFLKDTLTESKHRMENRAGKLKKRVREIYKNGGVNYLQMLLTSDTLANFINQSYYFEKIMGRDVVLINNIISEHKKITKDKKELEGTTQDIKELAVYIENKKENIEQQAEEKKQVYKDLEEKKADYEKKVAALEEASNQIESMIKTMLSERVAKGIVSPRGTGSIIWPVRGRITSTFGYRRSPFWRGGSRHTGLDIANSHGTPINAADGGEVIFSGWWDGYGKCAIIDHGKGISTLYGHMSRIYVQKGQTVAKCQVVGLMGSTGYSTGPHLHFEVRKNGTPQNPQRWLP